MASSAEQVRIWRLRVRGTEPPLHGTKHAYDAYGCRCGACRAAVAAKARKLYWQQRRVYSSDMARNPAVDGVLKSKGYDTKKPAPKPPAKSKSAAPKPPVRGDSTGTVIPYTSKDKQLDRDMKRVNAQLSTKGKPRTGPR